MQRFPIGSASCRSAFYGDRYYVNLYRVALAQGQTLTVTMEQVYTFPDYDPWLVLANLETGAVVASNDNDPTGVLGLGSRIVYTASETGVYVIEASSAETYQRGWYVLGVLVD